MAHLYPERLPESTLQDSLRSAERRVYDALGSLPDPFTVFYSVAWLSRSATNAYDGEADFVVAHPDWGLLVLEVKGGSIGYDAARSAWTSTDRNGAVHTIKDPAGQARTGKHTLHRGLQALPGWNNRWLTLGHAVVFPDVDTGTQSLRLDLPAQIVIDRSGLEQIGERIERAFVYFQGEDGQPGALGEDRLRLVTGLLARSFQMRTPLSAELAYEDERIIELTEQQMNILNFLANHRRAAIQGCAGSGKTMLAVEKARRLAEQGFDVLLTCFNVALAQHLAIAMPRNVTVLHFHGLCEALINEAEVRAIRPQNANLYYNEFLPNRLLDAIEELGPQYDAIVVDEGQDFMDEWWLGLSALLHDDKEGIFYIFFDDNQNLYRNRDRLPGLIDQAPFALSENCRNTTGIHKLVARFHPQGASIRCRAPQGREPEWIAYDSDGAMLKALQQRLHQLINEEGIASSDLVVLTPKAEDRSKLSEGLNLGNFRLTRKEPSRPTDIAVRTVHAFKGLDRRVVILAEVDPWASRELATVLYVGCSRARTHLLILHNRRLDPVSVGKEILTGD
ncbi:MAG: ATP-binding domain-containing protein [Chloroflexi bacterium]|nr:ATP-binding domain-containing protein [Chloroflexota bacterium]